MRYSKSQKKITAKQDYNAKQGYVFRKEEEINTFQDKKN
jgi:hypothetical protein